MKNKIHSIEDIDINKTCFFTGHRKIPKKILNILDLQLNDTISTKYKEGIRNFISGGALGFDTVAANYVLQLQKNSFPDINLILFLPSKDYTCKWKKQDRDVLKNLIKNAAFVFYTGETYTKDCMKIRNTALVQYSSCGIACLSHLRSGTSQTVSMALKANKPVDNICVLAEPF